MRQKIPYLIIGFILVLLVVLLVSFAFRGCSYLLLKEIYEDVGGRDWKVTLVNGFEIWKLNGNDIILIKDNWSHSGNIVISNYINAYSYNEQFIGIWCAKDGASSLLGADSEEDIFYIIDSHQNVIVGQYTRTEYERYCIEHEILDLVDWVYTTPRPDDAIFH